jgi:ERCC4-type nuclease
MKVSEEELAKTAGMGHDLARRVRETLLRPR